MADTDRTTPAPSDGGSGTESSSLAILIQEVRRRNRNALVIDAMYLFTTGFLFVIAVQGTWPAVIAAIPIATVLLFAWRSSAPFFVANVVAGVLGAVLTVAGFLPF
ncbi:hypothetical protein [Halovivax cerinus]|uniref:Uncharacterized protein n=1 Tax=Halovivax cerinus TaxID=1487865 RepID=A0ABD5NNI6_9EURY|nr:hypothetical protein [Halovivax cerinus]